MGYFTLVDFRIILLLHILLASWVVYDANKRNEWPLLRGLQVLLLGIVGLILYLLTRPKLKSDSPRPFLPDGVANNDKTT